MELKGTFTDLEKRLLAHLYDNDGHKDVVVTRVSDREFSVLIEGKTVEDSNPMTYEVWEGGKYVRHTSPGGRHEYKFSASLNLALIRSMDWPKWADLSDYPTMVEEGDWSGIRDSGDEAKAAIFSEALREFEANHG